MKGQVSQTRLIIITTLRAPVISSSLFTDSLDKDVIFKIQLTIMIIFKQIKKYDVRYTFQHEAQ